MIRVIRLAFAWLLAAGVLLGCTDAELELLPLPPPPAFDNTLEVQGRVCTQSTEDLEFPLRVLFLVDSSVSMQVADPPDPVTGITGRERAVRETVDGLFATGGDVKVSIVRFSSQTQPLTQVFDSDGVFESYFSDDPVFIDQRIPLLAVSDRTTNYINALSEAYAEIRHELTNADQESLALSTYSIIMISDGIPDAEQGVTIENSSDNIIGSVEQIMDLASLFHVSEMTLSTALLSGGNAQVNQASEVLLEDMADAGNGTFRKFASGSELNFLFVDLTQLKRVFTLRTLVAANLNTLVLGDEILPDSDGDGLDDDLELDIGSNPFMPDSDGDGCRDSLEHRFTSSGLDPSVAGDCDCFVPDQCVVVDATAAVPVCVADPDCVDADGDLLCDCIDVDADGVCDPSNYIDGDGDGLYNCEERWSGTNQRGADTDADGLVDTHEMRFGTSPDVDDFTDDLDWDSVPNGEEVRTATDPHFVSVEGRFEKAYRYELEEVGGGGPGRSCYEYSVGNITLNEMLEPDDIGYNMPSDIHRWGPAGQGYTGRNRILVFLGEVPFDDFDTYARFRVACIEAAVQFDGNYRNPPSGVMRVDDEDVVLVSEFDPLTDCITPDGGRGAIQ